MNTIGIVWVSFRRAAKTGVLLQKIASGAGPTISGPEAIRIAVGPAVVDSDIAAFHPSRFAKSFLER